MRIDARIDDLLNSINIICILTFFILEVLVDHILSPQADSKRRDDFIDNSFGSKFSPNASIGYFDTAEIPHGLYKTACNLFENSFFTYSLVKSLTVRKTIVPTFVFLSISVFAYYGFKQVPLALSVLQILFSAIILGDLIKHLILIAQLNIIHDAWINLFQLQDFKLDTDKYKALIYRYWLQYETLHARIPAGIPENVFSKLNPKLTQEWADMKTRYNIK